MLKPRHNARRCLAAIVAATALAGCSNIDCPLDNVVRMKCDLYASETHTTLKLTDVLTVTPAGRDTVLLNQATGISDFLLPLKEGGRRDTLLLHLSNTAGQSAIDTLFVDHEPQPHFESVDCPACVFHTITGVAYTSHALSQMPLTIDSVAVVRTAVNYDDIENLRIFLRSTAAQ